MNSNVCVLTRQASYEGAGLRQFNRNICVFTSTRLAIDQQQSLVAWDCHLDFMTLTITQWSWGAGNDDITCRYQNKLKTHNWSILKPNTQNKLILHTTTGWASSTHISPFISARMIIGQSDGERDSVLVNKCKQHSNPRSWTQGEPDTQVLWFWRRTGRERTAGHKLCRQTKTQTADWSVVSDAKQIKHWLSAAGRSNNTHHNTHAHK